MNSRTFFASVIRAPRAMTSRRSRSRSKTMVRAGQRLMPRHLLYRLTNSAASRAYLETGCKSHHLMMFGQKHSLCLISMESNAQPSESIPTKKGRCGRRSASGLAAAGTLLMWVSPCRGWCRAETSQARRSGSVREAYRSCGRDPNAPRPALAEPHPIRGCRKGARGVKRKPGRDDPEKASRRRVASGARFYRVPQPNRRAARPADTRMAPSGHISWQQKQAMH